MPRREIKKELMGFVRREVNEKRADWGELRRIKSQIIVKKGLPNIPRVVLQAHDDLSYIVLIKWSSELRIYLFDREGVIREGKSYYDSLKDIYSELQKKTKKIARYPQFKKPITVSQRDYRLDKRFQQVWKRLAETLRVPKKFRKNRPLIKGANQNFQGVFNTKINKGFVYVPHESSKHMAIYTYYSLYFFLPSSIRLNDEVSKALAFLMLRSFNKFKNEKLQGEDSINNILLKLESLSLLDNVKILEILNKITSYHDQQWTTSEFLVLMSLPRETLSSISRHNIQELFCQIYQKTKNMYFCALANICGLPFGFVCSFPSDINKNKYIMLFEWLESLNLSKILSYLQENEKRLSKGMLKTINEALNFQFANALIINMVSQDLGQFEIINRSDLTVILDNAVQILPDGEEIDKLTPQIILEAKSSEIINLPELALQTNLPVRFKYRLMESSTNTTKSIFTGTIIF